MSALDLALIQKANSFLWGKVRKTPVEYSPGLSKILDVPVYFKCEFMQITGSFKIRGAFFYLSTLNDAEKKKGVAACSAGNHGLGVAYAAKELGVECTIFVPKNVDQAKFEKLQKLGAKVRRSEWIGYDDTLIWAEKEAEKAGLHLISAFDDAKIMAGNGGTLAVEVLNELADAEYFVLPVGGGGLSGGFSYYVKEKKPKCHVTGCQHVDSPALKLSLESGKPVTHMPAVETVAGGIEGGLGAKCFAILKHRIDEVALVSEDEIKKAFCWMLEQHQYLIEPTAAVALAPLLFKKCTKPNGPVVLILSGRNVSFATLKQLL